MLDEVAKSAGFTDQQIIGKSMIGGSKSIQHWDAKEALQAGDRPNRP